MPVDLSSSHAQFYQNSYCDKQKLSYSYYNPLKIQVQDTNIKPAVLSTSSNYSQKDLNQIRQAFEQSNAEEIKPLVNSELNNHITLRSKYYINSISVKNKRSPSNSK